MQRKILINLETIRSHLNQDIDSWSDTIEVPGRKYKSMLKRGSSIPLNSLVTISKKLNLSLEAIYAGAIDYSALIEYYKGNHYYIPQKYNNANYSKKRTSFTIFNFMSKFIGVNVVEGMLRSFQIHPDAGNPNR